MRDSSSGRQSSSPRSSPAPRAFAGPATRSPRGSSRSTAWARVVFAAALERWFGWLANTGRPFDGFHVSLFVLELLALVAALVALSRYRFPLLSGLAAAAGWFFVTDLISNGGNWTAIVTIVVGLVLLGVGVAVDGGPSRPYGFWVHVVAGLTIGGRLALVLPRRRLRVDPDRGRGARLYRAG